MKEEPLDMRFEERGNVEEAEQDLTELLRQSFDKGIGATGSYKVYTEIDQIFVNAFLAAYNTNIDPESKRGYRDTREEHITLISGTCSHDSDVEVILLGGMLNSNMGFGDPIITIGLQRHNEEEGINFEMLVPRYDFQKGYSYSHYGAIIGIRGKIPIHGATSWMESVNREIRKNQHTIVSEIKDMTLFDQHMEIYKRIVNEVTSTDLSFHKL